MKYLKSYKLFESSSIEETEDLFLAYIDDNKCVCDGNEYFRAYEFYYLKDLIDIKNKLKLLSKDNYLSFDNNLFIYDIEIKDFFIDKLSNCEIVKSKQYPDLYLIWKKDGINLAAQDFKNKDFYINYEIWSIFESKYSMDYYHIKAFTEHMLYEHFKLEGYTTVRKESILGDLLYEHFKFI